MGGSVYIRVKAIEMKGTNDIEKWLDEGRRVPSDAEVEAAGQRFDARLRAFRFRRRWGWMSGVAAVAAGIAVAVVALWPREEEPRVVPVAEKVVVDEASLTLPTLILADGQPVTLDELAADTTVEDADIRGAERRISYAGAIADTLTGRGETRYNTLVIPAGHTYRLTLADGTGVTLNAGSRLRYPVAFTGEAREVELTGEAFFEVTKGERPFVVEVSGAEVRVYGTRFNVKLTKSAIVETVLVEGSIGFRVTGGEEIRVTPGEQVTYRLASGEVVTRTVDTRYATAWMDGVFRYSDRELDLILDDIAAWYGVTFTSTLDLSRIKLTMNLNKQTPIDEVVAFIALMTDCQITKEREVYTIKGK